MSWNRMETIPRGKPVLVTDGLSVNIAEKVKFHLINREQLVVNYDYDQVEELSYFKGWMELPNAKIEEVL